MQAPETCNEATLRDLVDAGAIRAVQVVAQGDAWCMEIQVGTAWRRLRSKRGPIRWWKSLDRLARWLRDEIGIAEWSVDARQYQPAQRSV